MNVRAVLFLRNIKQIIQIVLRRQRYYISGVSVTQVQQMSLRKLFIKIRPIMKLPRYQKTPQNQRKWWICDAFPIQTMIACGNSLDLALHQLLHNPRNLCQFLHPVVCQTLVEVESGVDQCGYLHPGAGSGGDAEGGILDGKAFRLR